MSAGSCSNDIWPVTFSRLMRLKALSSGQSHTQRDPWTIVKNIDMVLILGVRCTFILVGCNGGFYQMFSTTLIRKESFLSKELSVSVP